MRNSRTIRWLVNACLALSLTLTGLAPSLMSFADAGLASAVNVPQDCCCGTADGRCCGMACCISQSPPAPEKPVRVPTGDDYRPNLLVWARIDASLLALGHCSFGVRPTADAELSPAEASLQALHVRLDV